MRTRFRRSLSFRATHHYARPDRSDPENRDEFGPLVEPHEHEYRVTVWVEGPPDPETGFVVSLPDLDGALEALVGPLRGADLNEAVPAVARDGRLPSCETLAAWAFRELEPAIPDPARLVALAWDEGPDLGARVEG